MIVILLLCYIHVMSNADLNTQSDICRTHNSFPDDKDKRHDTETVIKLNFCQKWGEGPKTSIFFVTNE